MEGLPSNPRQWTVLDVTNAIKSLGKAFDDPFIEVIRGNTIDGVGLLADVDEACLKDAKLTNNRLCLTDLPVLLVLFSNSDASRPAGCSHWMDRMAGQGFWQAKTRDVCLNHRHSVCGRVVSFCGIGCESWWRGWHVASHPGKFV